MKVNKSRHISNFLLSSHMLMVKKPASVDDPDIFEILDTNASMSKLVNLECDALCVMAVIV